MDRQDRLLFLLVKENDSSKSIREIADLFGVTARTIRNDIEALNDVVVCNGARIKIERKGISIEIQDKEMLEDFLQSIESNRERVLTTQDRIRQIIETLLTSDQSVRMDDLADAMFISRATLKNDMKTVRNILADFGIEIDYRAYQGMRAIGSEQQYRLCLTRIQMEEPFYTQQLPENNRLDIIHKIITDKVVKYNFMISDLSLNNLTFHIYIAIQRILDGKVIHLGKETEQQMENDSDLAMTKAIIQDIEKEFDVKFPDSEVYYVLMHLSSKKIIRLNNGQQSSSVVDEDTFEIVLAMLEAVNETFRIDLRYDFELVTLLSLHVIPFKVRLQNHIASYNPLANQIREHFVLAYSMATVACGVLKKMYSRSICKDEIAYIALHFNVALEKKREKQTKEKVLIVCGSGRASSELLRYQIEEKFGKNLEVVGTASLNTLHSQNFDGIDYILTTVPIEQKLNIPVIEVNAFLGKSAIENVHAMIQKTRDLQIFNYFREDMFFGDLPYNDKEEVIHFLCMQAQKKVDISNGFERAVLERESIGATAFGNMVAIPHPIHPMGKESFVEIGILQKPIQWDKDTVQIIFLLSMKEKGDDTMPAFYKVLSQIVSSDEYTKELIRTQSFDKLHEIILKIEEESV